MHFIKNQKHEVLNTETLRSLIKEGGSVSVVSSDGKLFQVSKFMMRFLSFYFEDDHDLVITPVSSTSLNIFIDLINLNKSLCLENESSNYFQFLIYEGHELGLDIETMKNLLQIQGKTVHTNENYKVLEHDKDEKIKIRRRREKIRRGKRKKKYKKHDTNNMENCSKNILNIIKNEDLINPKLSISLKE